ncbi:MAG: cellulose synthase (UDP-forming) [Myxococcota bacterium]|jgi:cellulose synthase (UDP-forming)
MPQKSPDGRSYPGAISVRAARLGLLGLYLLVSAAYLAWRIGFTVPLELSLQGAYGVVFLGAELLLAWLSVTFFIHLNGGTRREPPPPPLLDATVDVLIPTYNEDVSLVRRTAVAARDMELLCNVWICDDGRREEMRQLAVELGVGYRIRPNNLHFKAGNLNAALADAESEFLLILDADHVPRRALLSRTLGYFSDPEVAFVQTPQVYYNIESFQHASDYRRGWLYHENSLFQHDIQAGSERYGAAFFVGTGAIFRRSALEEIGGIATETVTEDIHTAMRLHARGYRSVFVDEALAFLAGPETPLAFVQQRLRWAQGAMQILRKDNPLLIPGLKPWQRIAYLNALAGWLAGPATLVMWMAPAIFLLTGLSPIEASVEVALPVITTKVAVDLTVYLLLTFPQGRLLLSDCFRLMVAPLATFATLTFFKPDGLTFKVTPKGDHAGLPRASLVPIAAVAMVNLLAVAIGLNTPRYAPAEQWLGGLLILFCSYFLLTATYALLFAFERQSSDGESPIPVDLPASLPSAPSVVARAALLDTDLAWLRLSEPVPEGTPVTLSVPCPDGHPLDMQGEVVLISAGPGGHIARVRLDPIDPDDADRLCAFLYDVALPGFLSSFSVGPEIHDRAEPPPEGATTHRDFLVTKPSLL